jgi:hypothetical protein
MFSCCVADGQLYISAVYDRMVFLAALICSDSVGLKVVPTTVHPLGQETLPGNANNRYGPEGRDNTDVT